MQRCGHPRVLGRAGGQGWAVPTLHMEPWSLPLAYTGEGTHCPRWWAKLSCSRGEQDPQPCLTPTPDRGRGGREAPAFCFLPCQSGPSRGQPVPSKKPVFGEEHSAVAVVLRQPGEKSGRAAAVSPLTRGGRMQSSEQPRLRPEARGWAGTAETGLETVPETPGCGT